MTQTPSGSKAPRRLSATRRFFLGSAALAAGYFLFGKRIGDVLLQNVDATAAQLPAPTWVDAHCHIFNVRDVPAAEYIANVLVREQLIPLGSSFANLLKDLTWWLLDELDGSSDQVRTKVDSQVLRLTRYIHHLVAKQALTIDEEIEKLRVLVQSGGTMSYSLPDANDDKATLLKILVDLPLGEDGYADIRKQIESDFVTWLLDTITRRDDESLSDGQIITNEIHVLLAKLVKELDDEKRETIAKEIASKVYSPEGEESTTAAYLRFLISSTHQRTQILAEADYLFTAAKLKPEPKIRLFTPASIDYTFWLRGLPRSGADPGVPISSIEKQTELYGLIAKAQPENYWVHSFVGYDPLRHALAKYGNPPAEDTPEICTAEQTERYRNDGYWDIKTADPLAHLEDAITNHGCMGAKLYPPMGFRPYLNAEIDADPDLRWKVDNDLRIIGPFGPIMPANQRDFCRELPGQNGQRLGVLLDAVLVDFYAFCLKHDVPIMTHCSRTQGSFGIVRKEREKGADSTGTRTGKEHNKTLPYAAAWRAHPRHWIKLLEANGPNGESYAALRLNLSHAGGTWCLGAIDRSRRTSFSPFKKKLDEECDFEAGQTWFHRLVDFIDANPGKYPNVYFDLADWSDPVNEPALAKLAAEELVRLINDHDVLRERTLYGTDWVVMGTRPHYRDYFAKLHKLLSDTFEESGRSSAETRQILADICGRNALRFLGLGQGEQTRKRLERFFEGTKRKLWVFDELIG
jgi:predicted TIM-barrel fold metal-dependent hydrolase